MGGGAGVTPHALQGHCTWQVTTMVMIDITVTTVWEQRPFTKPIAKHQKRQSCWRHHVKRQSEGCCRQREHHGRKLGGPGLAKHRQYLGGLTKYSMGGQQEPVLLGLNDPSHVKDGPSTSNNLVREQRLCFGKVTLNLTIELKSHDLGILTFKGSRVTWVTGIIFKWNVSQSSHKRRGNRFWDASCLNLEPIFPVAVTWH